MNYEQPTTNNELRTMSHLTIHKRRESSYLRAYKEGISTTVEGSLQINFFMQNKPNLPENQVNVNPYNTMDYENKSNWTLGENEPNQSQLKPIKANSNPKRTQNEPNCRKGKN